MLNIISLQVIILIEELAVRPVVSKLDLSANFVSSKVFQSFKLREIFRFFFMKVIIIFLYFTIGCAFYLEIAGLSSRAVNDVRAATTTAVVSS
jgi:hypothetical protein